MPTQATPALAALKSNLKLPSSWTLLLDKLPGLIAIREIDSGSCIYISPNVKQLLGYSAPAFMRKSNLSVNPLIHPDDVPTVLTMQQQALLRAKKNSNNSDSLVDYECRIKHKDGSWRHFQTTASIFTTTDAGRAETVIFVSYDITERKNQEQLIESIQRNFHYRFQALVEKSNVGVVLRDANLHYTYASPAVEQVFGYSIEEYLQLQLEDYMHPEDFARFKPLIEDMRRTPGKTITTPIRIYHKDGTTRWVEVTATNLLHDPIIQAVVSNFRDITEQHEASEALRTSQERLNLTMQASGIGTWDWDIATNTVTWSKRLEELFGLQPGRFQGTFESYQQLIHPDDREHLNRVVNLSQESGEIYQVEYRTIHPDGSIHWLLGIGKAFRDEEGNLIRMLGVTMNIDERTELQRRKDEFMAIASHELKTPVTSLKVFAQMLARRLEAAGLTEMSNHMRTMDTQLGKLSNLINDLLDATKIDAGKMELRKEVFAIDELVQETCTLMQFTTTQHIISVTGSTGAKVKADRERIGQVLTNLLSNAIKYSPRADQVRVDLRQDRSNIIIDVVDYGIGISPTDQLHIFDRFFRAEGKPLDTYPGLGLGLYISAEIMRRHNGALTVTCHSKPGSVFTVTLPKHKQRSRAKS